MKQAGKRRTAPDRAALPPAAARSPDRPGRRCATAISRWLIAGAVWLWLLPPGPAACAPGEADAVEGSPRPVADGLATAPAHPAMAAATTAPGDTATDDPRDPPMLVNLLGHVTPAVPPADHARARQALADFERERERLAAEFRYHLEGITGISPHLIAEAAADHDFENASLDRELIDRLEDLGGRFLSPRQIQGYKRLEQDCRRRYRQRFDRLTQELATILGLPPTQVRRSLEDGFRRR